MVRMNTPKSSNTAKLFHAVVVIGIGLVAAEAACSSSSSTPTSSSSGSTGGTSGTSGASGSSGGTDGGHSDAMAGWVCCG